VEKNLVTMEKILKHVLDRFVPAASASSSSSSSASADTRIQVDSLVHARWIVPILPAVVHEHHSMAVRDGRIVDLLPTAEAKLKYRATNEEDFPTSTLMPGFVNAHSHLGMSLMRGYADDHVSQHTTTLGAHDRSTRSSLSLLTCLFFALAVCSA
jgi:imidazolonepropionase-like amidohydrolase